MHRSYLVRAKRLLVAGHWPLARHTEVRTGDERRHLPTGIIILYTLTGTVRTYLQQLTVFWYS